MRLTHAKQRSPPRIAAHTPGSKLAKRWGSKSAAAASPPAARSLEGAFGPGGNAAAASAAAGLAGGSRPASAGCNAGPGTGRQPPAATPCADDASAGGPQCTDPEGQRRSAFTATGAAGEPPPAPPPGGCWAAEAPTVPQGLISAATPKWAYYYEEPGSQK